MSSFHQFIQLDSMDCGPSCLRMVAKHYGKHYSLETLRQHSFITREGVSMLGISDQTMKLFKRITHGEGVSMLGISDAAEYLGFRTSI